MNYQDLETLQLKRKRHIQDLLSNMDFLMGSVSTKGLKCEAYNLTRYIDGRTRSKHIPIEKVEMVRALTSKHKRVKDLLKEIGELNWELLKHSEAADRYDI